MRQKHRHNLFHDNTGTSCGKVLSGEWNLWKNDSGTRRNQGRMRTGMENRTTGTGAYCRQTATGRDGVGDNDSNGVILK